MTESVESTGSGDVAELGVLFATIGSALHRSDGAAVDPDRLVRLAASAIPHASHCSVTILHPGRRAQAGATSDELATTVEELQNSLGEGPCLDAATGDDVVLVNDLGVDHRWPSFSPACIEQTGVRAILAVRLGLSRPARAAINFYATSAGVFAEADVSVATVLAPLAASALQAQLTTERIAQLEVALTTSRQIGAAVGITMAQRGLTYEQAFEQLRLASQHLNVKLRDLAAAVEYTGVVPDPPHRRARPPTTDIASE